MAHFSSMIGDTPYRGICTMFERVISTKVPSERINPKSTHHDLLISERLMYQLLAYGFKKMSKYWFAFEPVNSIPVTSYTRNPILVSVPCFFIRSALTPAFISQ